MSTKIAFMVTAATASFAAALAVVLTSGSAPADEPEGSTRHAIAVRSPHATTPSSSPRRPMVPRRPVSWPSSTPEEVEPEPPDIAALLEPPDLEHSRQRTLDQWSAQLDEHAREPVDASWASEAQADFDRDLLALAGRLDAHLVDIDCRTRTCTGRVEFPSFDAAATQHSELLHHDYATNCARTTILPEPEDVTQPYVATVLFDCREQ